MEAAPEVAVSVQGLGVRFGGLSALMEVNVDIPANEVAAIVGANGAGKTTLLNAISGFIRRNVTGRIELFGEEIQDKSTLQISRMHLSRSFQDPPLLEKETVLENVLVGEHLALTYNPLEQIFCRGKVRRLEREARERAEAVMELTGTSSDAYTLAGSLPYGKRKLVDLTRAIVARPRILLLDEPTSGLDAGEQASVKRILLELASEKTLTVVVVEHHMDVVRTVASTVVGMHAGGVLVVGTPNDVLDSEAFRAAATGLIEPE